MRQSSLRLIKVFRTTKQLAYLPQHFPFDRRLPMTVEELVGLDARGESEFYHLLYRLKQE